MEENELRSESEPGVQTESLSLIISEEGEEATPPYSASRQRSADEDDMTNGDIGDDGQASLLTEEGQEGQEGHDEDDMTNGDIGDDGQTSLVSEGHSTGTSYWSVSESPDSPYLLSPVPGPSRHRLGSGKSEWASRMGYSRIPGRDHRRYYHEHWRSEYLMDFDPKRNGMICMVCGSSLATLKLSTIKRHIRQKHPDSLLWSASDKEMICSGWESHVKLENSQEPCLNSAISPEQEENPESDKASTDQPSDVVVNKSLSESHVSTAPASASQVAPSLLNEMLERYVNDSLHAWFRQEFLMEYQARASRLVCMVCGCPLPSLHLDHIKSHVLEQHPNSLMYSAEEKHRILQRWAQSHDSDSVSGPVKLETETKDATELETEPVQHSTESYRVTKPKPSVPPQRFPKTKMKTSCPWHLRLDYLVAIGPPGMPGCYCMVCSEQLPLARVSSFRRHIQDNHPETIYLTQRERENIASAWTQDGAAKEPETLPEQEAVSVDAMAMPPPVDGPASHVKPSSLSRLKKDRGRSIVMPFATHSGWQSHYKGKDQRRFYQLRWRMDYLMDYDCRRHGLICMVCGTTLATLKLSTIKRHIQNVHPYSLDYGEEEKQQVLERYSQTTLTFVHSEDCSSDHSHVAQPVDDQSGWPVQHLMNMGVGGGMVSCAEEAEPSQK